jgi:hypothetical protein
MCRSAAHLSDSSVSWVIIVFFKAMHDGDHLNTDPQVLECDAGRIRFLIIRDSSR